MDDLLGLDWKSPQEAPKSTTPSFPSLQPAQTPSGSGRSTPIILRPSSTANSQPSLKIGSKPGTPANDSFANLLGGGNAKQTSGLSLQERQRQLIQEKAKQEAEQKKRLQSQFGAHHDAFWDGLGNGQGRGNSGGQSTSSLSKSTVPITKNDDEDFLAAFSSSAPVDASSHFPPGSSIEAPNNNIVLKGNTRVSKNAIDFEEDDDLLGLNQLPTRHKISDSNQALNNDDDILGMLGRPVEEVASLVKPQIAKPMEEHEDNSSAIDPQDKAVAELVDMGFPPDKAAIALAATDSGVNVQTAVGILLNQAHEDSKKKVQSKEDGTGNSVKSKWERDGENSRKQVDESVPAWMRRQDDSSPSSSQTREQGYNKEKDVSKIASEIGNSIFKSANSLWKTGQKKVQRAMADLQQEGDSNQPKWMRDAQIADTEQNGPNISQRKVDSKVSMPLDMTDEARLLESRGQQNQSTDPILPPRKHINNATLGENRSRTSTPIDRRNTPSPGLSAPGRSANRLTREELEHNGTEVYISPARRRKPQPPPRGPSAPQSVRNAPPIQEKSPLASPPLHPNNPFANATPKPPSKPSISTPRPKASPRKIPPTSSAALSTSTSHRQSGTEAFKRGDYSSAHTSYTSALQPLPHEHPIAIVIFCNRALTSMKVGDPKAAVADADSALDIIGISKGDGEKIHLGAGEGEKEMKEFYGKALMRKAEALEHLERWADAAKVWREVVAAGLGGPLAIQGRNRCEKAANPSNTSSTATRPNPARSQPKPGSRVKVSTSTRPAVDHAASAEAVRKLREANAAAEKADDEKFALTDKVDTKLTAWKGTKADNLRALLGSLDKVLWEGAGWTKVGMQDLVMTNRVKIVYMKAIAKVHPDKIPQDASTEQRMISGAVFSTLNEAWDKFKIDNKL